MKIVKRGVYADEDNIPQHKMLDVIERAARTCYKSEDLITEDSNKKLIKGLIKSGHHAPLEFGTLTFKIICDRATATQIVRHRLASFCAESTRYCNYSKDKFGNEIKVIIPEGLNNETYPIWRAHCLMSETMYFELLSLGAKPEVARSVLPHCLATELSVCMNIRELRHFIDLRCDSHAQKDIRSIATMLLNYLHVFYPVFFDDLYAKYIEK